MAWPRDVVRRCAGASRRTLRCHDEELEDARWFTREDLAGGIEDGSLRAPNPVSIAFRLIEEWYDEGGEPFADVLAACRKS